MRLLYGTTSSLVVTLAERFYGSTYFLYFADAFNAWPVNPPSSNPFQIYLDFAEIVRTQDARNPKYTAHVRAVRKGIRARLRGTPYYPAALGTVSALGVQGLNPYLALLEGDTYETNRGTTIQPLLPGAAGSPTSIEYKLTDVQGPSAALPELHLQKLHF